MITIGDVVASPERLIVKESVVLVKKAGPRTNPSASLVIWTEQWKARVSRASKSAMMMMTRKMPLIAKGRIDVDLIVCACVDRQTVEWCERTNEKDVLIDAHL